MAEPYPVKKKREKKKPLPLVIDEVPAVQSVSQTARVKKRGRRLSSSSGEGLCVS